MLHLGKVGIMLLMCCRLFLMRMDFVRDRKYHMRARGIRENWAGWDWGEGPGAVR
jgi:hypothetical protein